MKCQKTSDRRSHDTSHSSELGYHSANTNPFDYGFANVSKTAAS